MLELEGVKTFYGPIQALFGVSLSCAEGKVTTLIGRNGMGKTTTVSSIIGINPCQSGEIRFLGERIDGRPAYGLVRYIDAHKGKANALASMGYTVAEAVMPGALVLLLLWAGWRHSWQIAGGILLFVTPLWLVSKLAICVVITALGVSFAGPAPHLVRKNTTA